VVLAPALRPPEAAAQEISSPASPEGSKTVVRAVREGDVYVGFDGFAAEPSSGKESLSATVRLSSRRLITARRCAVDGGALLFSGLVAREGCGLKLGESDFVRVEFGGAGLDPEISFRLTIGAFDREAWLEGVGKEPFHFLALHLPEAEAWHQRGWLNATPLADPFPLLGDVHAGTPEISAYKYARSWSYTPPLGAHPIPVIGLWAPARSRYAALDFLETRLREGTEKDIATGYRWIEPRLGAAADAGQFVALVYPHGGRGYQDLVFPEPGAVISSRCVLRASLRLPAWEDPNRLLLGIHYERRSAELAPVPKAPDVSWIPGGIRLRDFAGPPSGLLIGGEEKPFQVPGTRLIGGWAWHAESPTAVAVKRRDQRRLERLEREAAELLRYAQRFDAGGDPCVYWEKPLEGAWTPEWGGAPVSTLHNANGFAAGRLFLGLYRDLGRNEHLWIVDGVFNWARRIAWTRNEFADVPSSPFAIGGTLSASFCLEYWMTFRDAPDEEHRRRAREALDLAEAFTYRYLVMWTHDNDRDDDLDPVFLWEPNSGRDWTGAACANEVFWNLDTLAQTAVHTGDRFLCWALAGSLSRWHQLYQEVYKESLAEYQGGDMTEGFGLYADNVYGVGFRAAYGFAAPLVMTEPVGEAAVRVLAGEGAALAFRKGAEPVELADCAYGHPGNLAFTIRSSRGAFDVALTVPYVDLSAKPAAVVRGGETRALTPGEDLIRSPLALWSLYLKGIESGDRVVIGEPGGASGAIACAPQPAEGVGEGLPPGFDPAAGFQIAALAPDGMPSGMPSRSWEQLDSLAGLPLAGRWIHGIPFALAAREGLWAAAAPSSFKEPIAGAECVYLLYTAGGGPPPALVYAGEARSGVEGGDRNGPDLEASAWRAWPPIYTAWILAGRYPVPKGKTVTGVDPRGRAVLAATAFRAGDARQAETRRRVSARFDAADREWKRVRRADETAASLRRELEAVPRGAIALLPPEAAGITRGLLGRVRFGERAVNVAPEVLVDRAAFNAELFPVALYAGGEDYVDTVREAGDAAGAVVRYLEEGGSLVIIGTGPWPFYYATGPGFKRAEPLTARLGLPLVMAVESPAPEELLVRVCVQALVETSRDEFPYPPGDSRLRTIDRRRLPARAVYTAIAQVVGKSGKEYGDAAGVVELPARGGARGSVLYIAHSLLADPIEGPAFLAGALRFVARIAKR
jgi:hypothetical protein